MSPLKGLDINKNHHLLLTFHPWGWIVVDFECCFNNQNLHFKLPSLPRRGGRRSGWFSPTTNLQHKHLKKIGFASVWMDK